MSCNQRVACNAFEFHVDELTCERDFVVSLQSPASGGLGCARPQREFRRDAGANAPHERGIDLRVVHARVPCTDRSVENSWAAIAAALRSRGDRRSQRSGTTPVASADTARGSCSTTKRSFVASAARTSGGAYGRSPTVTRPTLAPARWRVTPPATARARHLRGSAGTRGACAGRSRRTTPTTYSRPTSRCRQSRRCRTSRADARAVRLRAPAPTRLALVRSARAGREHHRAGVASDWRPVRSTRRAVQPRRASVVQGRDRDLRAPRCRRPTRPLPPEGVNRMVPLPRARVRASWYRVSPWQM